MIQNEIDSLQEIVDTIPEMLSQIDETEFCYKSSPEKWSKKEILGHLIDSAANNHQRFIRIQYENNPMISYDQNHWNNLSNYNKMDSSKVINFWKLYNIHLIEILKVIPEENLQRNGCTNEKSANTLEWYIIDYVVHLKHHLKQIFPEYEINTK